MYKEINTSDLARDGIWFPRIALSVPLDYFVPFNAEELLRANE